MKQIGYILCSLLLFLNFACNAMNNQNKKPTHYEILGVAQNATTEEITKEYRKLALRNHPDKNLGNQEAVERFKNITTAYDILKDNELRLAYNKSLNIHNNISYLRCDFCGTSKQSNWFISSIMDFISPCCSIKMYGCNICLKRMITIYFGKPCTHCDKIIFLQQDPLDHFEFIPTSITKEDFESIKRQKLEQERIAKQEADAIMQQKAEYRAACQKHMKEQQQKYEQEKIKQQRVKQEQDIERQQRLERAKLACERYDRRRAEIVERERSRKEQQKYCSIFK